MRAVFTWKLNSAARWKHSESSPMNDRGRRELLRSLRHDRQNIDNRGGWRENEKRRNSTRDGLDYPRVP